MTAEQKTIKAKDRTIKRLRKLLSDANCKGLKLISKKIDLEI